MAGLGSREMKTNTHHWQDKPFAGDARGRQPSSVCRDRRVRGPQLPFRGRCSNHGRPTPGPALCSQLLLLKGASEAGRARQGRLPSLRSSSQPGEDLKATLRKRPGQVEAMVGFWCLNKMLKDMKSAKRRRDKIWNLKTTRLPPLQTPGDRHEVTLPAGAIFQGNKCTSLTQYTRPLMFLLFIFLASSFVCPLVLRCSTTHTLNTR